MKNKIFLQYVFCSIVAMLAISTASYASIPTEEDVYVLLQSERVFINRNLSEEERIKAIRNFIKRLKKLSDGNLGSPELLREQSSVEVDVKVDMFKQKIKGLVAEYETTVKPILLENVQLKRMDDAAKHNLGELIQLSFPTRFNHKTGKPVIGLLHYKKGISYGFFDSKTIDAGVFVTFPNWKSELWLQNAIQMDVELTVLRKMHIAYQDKKVFKTDVKVKNRMSSLSPAGQAIPHDSHEKPEGHEANAELSLGDRAIKVSRFVKSLKKLKVEPNIEEFKRSLQTIVVQYEQVIKPILIANVNQQRRDMAAKNNKGDLISLFFPNKDNHQTGQPVMGKLRYKKDVSTSFFSSQIEEAGLLIEHPDMIENIVIQAGLTMEKELEVLKEEHRDYLETDSMTFVH